MTTEPITYVSDMWRLLDGAKLVIHRPDLSLLFVWNGSRTVNVYDPWWRCVDCFTRQSDDAEAATVEQVEQSIREYAEPT